LLDVNVLLALTETAHVHYHKAQHWFHHSRKGMWGFCSLTETGFIRITTNPTWRPTPRSIPLATAILRKLQEHPDFRYWDFAPSWGDLTASFAMRIHGHQQVTDSWLLGLAIRENGVLVTFDKGIRYLAGEEFSHNLCVLE
jgi:hypothetical protein